MFRLFLVILVIAAIVLLWKGFGPGYWAERRRNERVQDDTPAIKGPDDDEEFLWNLEKERFKKRREAERLAQEEEELRRRRDKENHPESTTDESPDT